MKTALGPDNWYEAWWLAGRSRQAISWASAQGERPDFAELSLDEFRFVLDVFLEGWRLGPGDWDSAEWRTIEGLEACYFERVAEARRKPAEQASASLRLPSLDHDLLRSEPFLCNVWRLRGLASYDEWLAAELGSPRAELLHDHVDLRALVAELAERKPCAASFAALRSVYRDPARASEVREADARWIEKSQDEGFGQRIARLGLHAPLERSAYPVPPRRSSVADAEVTVLIPSYKHEAFIADCLETCLAQTIDGVEILVVDDQSPDETVEVARSLADPRITVEINERNLGLGDSIAAALERVTTPYVALLNSDDLFHPERLERCLAVLRADGGAALVASRVAIVDSNGQEVEAGQSCVLDVGPRAHAWLQWYAKISDELTSSVDWTSLATLLQHNVLATSSNIVARSDWLRSKVAAFAGLRYCLDWRLFLAASIEGSLRFCEEALLGYRFHESNTVWFESGGRGGYVYEVNRVLAASLAEWIDHAGADTAKTRDELRALLHEAALRHGEADGALLATALVERLLQDGAFYDDAAIDEASRQAISRRARELALGGVTIDPWELAGLASDRERLHVATHAADVLARRGPQLEDRLEQLEKRAADLDRQRVDLDDRLNATIVARDEARSALETHRAEHDRLSAELTASQEESERKTEEIERQAHEIAGLTAELEDRVSEIAAIDDASRGLLGGSSLNRVRRLRERARELRVQVHELEAAPRPSGFDRLKKRVRAEAKAVFGSSAPRASLGVVLPGLEARSFEIDAAWELEVLADRGYDFHTHRVPSATADQVRLLARQRRRWIERHGARGERDAVISDAVAAMALRLVKADSSSIVAYGVGDAAEAARLAADALGRAYSLRVFELELRELGPNAERARTCLREARHVVVDSPRAAELVEDLAQVGATLCAALGPGLSASSAEQGDRPENVVFARGSDLARRAASFVEAVETSGLPHELWLASTAYASPEGLEAHETLVHALHDADLFCRSSWIDGDVELRLCIASAKFSVGYGMGSLPWMAAALRSSLPLFVPSDSSLAEIVAPECRFDPGRAEHLGQLMARLGQDDDFARDCAARAADKYVALLDAEAGRWRDLLA